MLVGIRLDVVIAIGLLILFNLWYLSEEDVDEASLSNESRHSNASDEQDHDEIAKILTSNPNRVSFGDVTPGSLIEVEFELTNNSAQKLLILGIDKSCGCLVESSLDTIMEAGSTQTISISVDTRRKRGPFEQAILVRFRPYASTEGSRSLRLLISGAIIEQQDVSVTPGSILLGDLTCEEDFACKMTVGPSATAKSFAGVERIHLPRQIESRIEEGTEATTIVIVGSAGRKVGKFNHVMRVYIRGVVQPMLVPISGTVVGTLEVSPSSIVHVLDVAEDRISLELMVSGRDPVRRILDRELEVTAKDISGGKLVISVGDTAESGVLKYNVEAIFDDENTTLKGKIHCLTGQEPVEEYVVPVILLRRKNG